MKCQHGNIKFAAEIIFYIYSNTIACMVWENVILEKLYFNRYILKLTGSIDKIIAIHERYKDKLEGIFR